MEAKRLNLGCGNHPLEGFINVDLNPKWADVVADIRDLSVFGTDSVDEIVASHVIEHFYLWEVQDILIEWKRVLRPGGTLYVECPNIHNCALMLLHGGFTDQMHMWGFFGDPSHKEPLMCHKWGYNPDTLAKELLTAGFVNPGTAKVSKSHWRDMRLVATKPENTGVKKV